ncbi:MAG: protein translocase subunit SecD, partial [Gemmataceae bacterium]
YAKAGLPPPGPTREGGYNVTINEVEVKNVVYAWNELSKEERESLGLSNKYATKPPVTKDGSSKTWLYPVLAKARAAGKNEVYLHTYSAGEKSGTAASMLLYSRECLNENISEAARKDKQVEYFVLTRISDKDAVRVAGAVSLSASSEVDPKSLTPCVSFRFNGAGADKFGDMTQRNRVSGSTIRSLAILLDDMVVSSPTLNSPIRDSGQITGNFDKASVDRIVYILRSGALTAELKPNPVSENTVGPTLGLDTITKGVTAVGLSFVAVLVFMVIYYRVSGVIACVALLANLLLTVGFMVGVNAAFTLAGLAGIVLMLGMAVDANVLIYERLREERERGITLAAAIRNGYDRALPTIIDTHLSSIFTAIILYTFGNDNLKGFSISLTVGLIISLFTSLYMTRLMFDFWLVKFRPTELRMMHLFKRPNINFMKIRYGMLTLTAVSSIVGLGLFLYRGEAVLNVDFTKGTAFGGRLLEPLALRDSGKGLLDRVSEDRQKKLLTVKEVFPAMKATAEAGDSIQKSAANAMTEKSYTIIYEGAKDPVVVTLANKPDGSTEAEQLENLKLRASGLPDVSVEQVSIAALDGNLPSGTTKSFTLRTTEREKELVQIMLDRLLRDDADKSLLAMAQVSVPKAVAGPTVELNFDQPTSVSYVTDL